MRPVAGMDVIVSNHLPPMYERRGWRERLFQRPWRPWRRLKQIPNNEVYRFGGKLLVSPQTYDRLKKEAQKWEGK